MRMYSNGRDVAEAEGKNVRQLILDLESHYPGMKHVLLNEAGLRPGVAVVVDGQIAPLGLYQSLEGAREVTFIPAIGGG